MTQPPGLMTVAVHNYYGFYFDGDGDSDGDGDDVVRWPPARRADARNRTLLDG